MMSFVRISLVPSTKASPYIEVPDGVLEKSVEKSYTPHVGVTVGVSDGPGVGVMVDVGVIVGVDVGSGKFRSRLSIQ